MGQNKITQDELEKIYQEPQRGEFGNSFKNCVTFNKPTLLAQLEQDQQELISALSRTQAKIFFLRSHPEFAKLHDEYYKL